ncbi:hypothetical protein R1sor_020552 [Riccia sorocarpa]|uniref:Uncharacterized protein n=1 Tax=Riccia sorocarpa TaxID=122646 RepID=A0ABD3IJI8_9MARC
MEQQVKMEAISWSSLSLIVKPENGSAPGLFLTRSGYAKLEAVADPEVGGLQRRRFRLRIRPKVRVLFTSVSSVVQRIKRGYARFMLTLAAKARDSKLLPGLGGLKKKRGAPAIGQKPKARTVNPNDLEQKYLDYIKRLVADGELAYYTKSFRTEQPPSVSGEDTPAERPRRRQRRQENLPGWVRPDSPEDVDGEDVGQSSRGRRAPSPPPPAALPAVERRQLVRRPAEAPRRPPPVEAVESEEEEDEPKRKVRKDVLPEGDYLVKWSSVEDKVRYIRWGAISTEHLRDAIASIADWIIRESGLDRALCRPMHKPHLAACMEFVHSFEKSRDKLSGTGTV